MSNNKQAKRLSKKQKLTGWDQAIADAEKRIQELRFSIEVFKDRKNKGERCHVGHG